MKKSYGYIRVSSEEQAEHGHSLVAQTDKIEQYCRLHGIELERIIADEGISGRTIAKRPGMTGLLDEIKQGNVRAIVAVKLDRIARNTREAIDIAELCRKNETDMHLIQDSINTNTAMGRFFFTIIAALATLESEQIGERVKAVFANRKEKGLRYCRNIPYGYCLDGEYIVKDSDEQYVIEMSRNMRELGKSYDEIIEHMKERGIQPRKGTWSRSKLQTALYAG